MADRRATDHGFFGPGSVTWKVWTHPTSLTIGFQRAVVIEELDPFLVASVQHTGQVRTRPRLRYDRTVQYFATVALGDAASVLHASDILLKIHAKAVGPEPVTGRTYDANDPDSQMWIHLTAWHSVLYAYEVYGPGRLSDDEEDRYWQECALAAEFQTIDPADVPRSRSEVSAWLEAYRPRLVGSEVAQEMMNHLLHAALVLPAWVPAPARWVVDAVMRRATIATMPRWMRRLGGTPQSRLTDLAVLALVRPLIMVVSRSVELQLVLLKLLAPLAVPVAEPILRRTQPVEPVTWTPADARAAFGHRSPREQYAEILARRAGGDLRPTTPVTELPSFTRA